MNIGIIAMSMHMLIIMLVCFFMVLLLRFPTSPRDSGAYLNTAPGRCQQLFSFYFSARWMVPPPTTRSPSYKTTACPGVTAR